MGLLAQAGKKGIDRSFLWLTRLMALILVLILLAIALTVFWQAKIAIATFGMGFITSSDWNPQAGANGSYGVLPQIFGTLVSSGLALLIAVPVGLGVAVCLSEDWDFVPKFGQTSLTFLIELLAAIPSVVYGLWGIFVLVPWLRSLSPSISSRGMFPAALVLAIMILPAIASISKDALDTVPTDLRLAAMSLGATRWQCILGVQIPGAGVGIVGAILLSLGRAMGETMAVTMLIGNTNQIHFSIFAPASTIASLLANQYNEATGLQGSALMYAALILFGLTLLSNMGAEFLIARISNLDAQIDSKRLD